MVLEVKCNNIFLHTEKWDVVIFNSSVWWSTLHIIVIPSYIFIEDWFFFFFYYLVPHKRQCVYSIYTNYLHIIFKHGVKFNIILRRARLQGPLNSLYLPPNSLSYDKWLLKLYINWFVVVDMKIKNKYKTKINMWFFFWKKKLEIL